MDHSWKKDKQRGSRIWNFQCYQRISSWNLQELVKKRWIFLGWSRKNDVEFPQGSSLLALHLPRTLTQFYRNSRGEVLFCLVFPGIKQKSSKLQWFFSKRYILNSPCVFFFGIVHLQFTGQWGKGEPNSSQGTNFFVRIMYGKVILNEMTYDQIIPSW